MAIEPDETARFHERLQTHLDAQSFVKLVLGKYRGADPDLRNVIVRRVTVRACDSLSLVFRYRTRDVTRNEPLSEGVRLIHEWLGADFKSAHLFTLSEDLQLVYNRKGRAAISVARASHPNVPPDTHNREKTRLIEPSRPYLFALGVTSAAHAVLPSMSRKWKQINAFLAIFDRALREARLDGGQPMQVVDFGSGKGYLTFAVHDYLQSTLGLSPRVTGVELRDELVRQCNDVAAQCGLEGLEFHRGDVTHFNPGPVQILIALHACDTATDLAMHMGIKAGAAIIMCAPCCHREIRPQLQAPPMLEPVLRFGVHLGEEAAMVTDSLRALLLESCGYTTQVFEFTSLEHTSKNRMILAVRRPDGKPAEGIAERIRALKLFYGIREQRLETLLLDSLKHASLDHATV